MRQSVLLVLLLASAAQGAEQVVWQIGRPDRSYLEFAFAGDYHAYAKAFAARPVVFDVGKSDARQDWPFIQPGPDDAWSPAAGQPRIVRFQLPEQPRGVYALRIEFADVHHLRPPLFMVAIGDRSGSFQLSPGGGDASLTDPRAGKPQKLELVLPASCFKQGANEIRLTCAEGSWVQYDAITLLADKEGALPPASIQSVTVRPTPFFIRRDGHVRRAVEVGVATSGPGTGLTLHVEAGGKTIDVAAKRLPLFGSIIEEVGVPDSPEPLDVKVTAALNGRAKSAAARVLPQRKWRIYVAPSSHTDIGYTDVQPRCAERHCQNLDTAIDLIRRYPEFCWNTETAWQAENYVNSRSGQRREEFYRLAREGKLGVQALFCNELTGLCSHEVACRLTWFAHKLYREHGVPYGSAMISDVPTQEATLPMILASAGIRYFSSGINNDRAYPFTRMQDKCPCWWEGPDGSRVLMMYTWGYAQASGWGLTESLRAARQRVLQNLAGYEGRKDYPFDAVFLHGAVGDNQPLDGRLAEVARQWNEKYEYPKLILSRNAEFFEYIEKRFGDKLPVFRGSAGTYWEDGAASSARETALCRNAQERLGAGEAMLALAEGLGAGRACPAADLYQAWRNCILYDEHTWGAYCSISDPDSEFTKAQWKIKAQFAADADQQSKAILDRGSRALAGLVRTGQRSLVVFNPASWMRTDVLRVDLPKDVAIVEPGVTPHPTPHGTFVLVKDVPSHGYRLLKLGPAGKQPGGEKLPGNVIESRFYRVEFDRASGGIASVRDKELDRELVDRKAPYQLNQYLYVAGGSSATRIVMNPNAPSPDLKITASGKATLQRKRVPGMGEVMNIHASGAMAHEIVSEVLVWDAIKRIDIINFFTKEKTYAKEAVYFTFPFAAEKPTVRYEAPCGIVNANRDMLPGACLDWFTVQHFVELESRDAAIAWATPDAPLACFQDINRGKWLQALPMNNGHIYSYALNNYWHTNYCAGQGGDYVLRYSITSRKKADNVASARFGWEVANPLRGVVVPSNPQGTLPGEATSLVSVGEPNVLVAAMKRADEGKALILRLWEVSGRPTTAHVKLNAHMTVAKAQACNLVEEPGGPLEIRDGQIAVPIRAAGLATVRIE